MTLGDLLIPTLVLFYCAPILLDGVYLEANSYLHSLWVYNLGTFVQFIPKHTQHGLDYDRTTDVLLHVFCAHLQVIFGSPLSELLLLPIDL